MTATKPARHRDGRMRAKAIQRTASCASGGASGSERPHTAKEARERRMENRKQETEDWSMGLGSALTGFEFPVSRFRFFISFRPAGKLDSFVNFLRA